MPQLFESVTDEKGTPLKHYKRDVISKIIYRDEMISGIHFRFSTRETELSKAQKRANSKIAEHFRREKTGQIIQPVLADEMKILIADYEKRANSGDIARHTLNTVRSSLAKLKPFWGGFFPVDITKERWTEYQDWFEKTYPGENQFNVKKYLNVIVSHCIEKGLLLKRPTIKDRHAKKQREMRKKSKSQVYSNAEILAIDDACVDTIDRLAVRLGYMMGFRISDVVQLSWDRVHLNGKTPYISFTEGDDKADFEGRAPVPDDIVILLRMIPRVSKWVFPQKIKPEQHLKPQQFDYQSIKESAEVTWGTFHSLRHYRLSKDFKNPAFTSMQVCLIRRVSLETAKEHYVHTEERDLELLRNSGGIKSLEKDK